MCGIVGYVGKASATQVLLGGLRRLEYRGYDSAGVAVIDEGKLVIGKAAGKVSVLQESIRNEWDSARIDHAATGIAHTRWATHGPPTQVNAHPHADRDGRIALVHNGIIENYRALRQRLESKGHRFLSDTDTEVLAHLIGETYQTDLMQAVCDALHQVEGTFGIAVISPAEPDLIVTARRGSPIVIGVGDGEAIIASDASAIISHTRQVIYLEDNDIAVVKAGHVEVRDFNRVPVVRGVSELGFDTEAAEKGGYEHFMLKEIHEQPESLRNAIRGRLDFHLGSSVLSGMGTSPRDLAGIRRVVLLGCGTSLHAGLVGEYAIEDLAGIHAEVQQAAEFRYRNPTHRARGPGDRDFPIRRNGRHAGRRARSEPKGRVRHGPVQCCRLDHRAGDRTRRVSPRGAGDFRGVHQGLHLPGRCAADDRAQTRPRSRFSREEGIQLAREIEACRIWSGA
jgi:glutamine---fructose-6-phosphate transaminase (isomerizing)